MLFRSSADPLGTPGALTAALLGYGTLANPLAVFGASLLVFYVWGSRVTKVRELFVRVPVPADLFLSGGAGRSKQHTRPPSKNPTRPPRLTKQAETGPASKSSATPSSEPSARSPGAQSTGTPGLQNSIASLSPREDGARRSSSVRWRFGPLVRATRSLAR